MVSQTAEYALRAVVFLAAAPDTPRTTEQIARHTGVPRGYLSKVLKQLGRADLLRARRGLHGGFVLARSPEAITVLDVVQVVDPIQRIHECPLGIEAHGRELCPLHRKLDNAMAALEATFSRTTIAEMLTNPDGAGPLCDTPGDPTDDKPTA